MTDDAGVFIHTHRNINADFLSSCFTMNLIQLVFIVLYLKPHFPSGSNETSNKSSAGWTQTADLFTVGGIILLHLCLCVVIQCVYCIFKAKGHCSTFLLYDNLKL